MAYLEIKDFTKSFGENQVLKGIDFTLEKGEVLSIIGSSGSGKTTLLRCVNFLEKPDFGSMTVDGETLIGDGIKDTERTLRQKRLNFGLVFQSFNLFPHFTVIKNVTLAPELLLKENYAAFCKTERSKSARKEYLAAKRTEIHETGKELLAKVGLSEKAESYPWQLSGGQQQRVAIARALAMRPKVLCFDEPTSALDPELTGEVLKVIRSLKGDGRTMIIVTHEMEFAKNVSDKIIYLADGKIEDCGTPEEIFGGARSEKLNAFLASVNDKGEA